MMEMKDEEEEVGGEEGREEGIREWRKPWSILYWIILLIRLNW